MKDQWYGDSRDLVKWGILLHLASIYSTKRIIQIAYFRPSEWKSIEIDGHEYPIPQSVVAHFRNILNIQDLTKGLRIEVFNSLFDNRDTYNRKIEEALCGSHPCIVFLDPDTGLQPPGSSPKLEHVLGSELKNIWDKMPFDDVLVFYQHRTNRNGQDWIEPKRAQFEDALGLPRGNAKVAHGTKIANDVVFFYCRKEVSQ